MCGIYGITEKNEQWVENYINKCFYRGPDFKNIYSENDITLGHNLLSITDTPTNGSQPWKTPRGNILVYNGEIFNYEELCKKFNKFIPKTSCDTELLAWGLDELGFDFLEHIDSMHAFAYWKKKEKKLFLSRDHVGIKPLYYSNIGSKLVFGSEAKGLLNIVPYSNIIDENAISCWSHCGLNVTSNSFFSGIKKVMPGETLMYEPKFNKIKSIRRDIIVGGAAKNYNSDDFLELFDNTVKNYLIGSRKIGVFLSGGLDSTMIAHHAKKYKKFKTFTNKVVPCPISTKEDYNSDHSIAKKFALLNEFDHYIVKHTPQFYANFWYSSIKAVEEPFYNWCIPMYEQTNKIMNQERIVVTLSGDMGDEILCGYEAYYHVFKQRKKINNHRECVKLWLTKRLSQPPNIHQVKINNEDIVDLLIETTFPESLWDKDDFTSSYMRLDQLGLCPEDYFRRNDRLGMKYSMEGRFPFASKNLMNYVMNIHSKYKFKNSLNKLKLMSKKTYKSILPPEVIKKEKTGWTAPIYEWKKHRKDDCEAILKIAKHVSLDNFLELPDDKRWAPLLQFYTWIHQNSMKLN